MSAKDNYLNKWVQALCHYAEPSKLGIPFWGIKIIETDHSMIYSCVEYSYENSGNDDLRYPIALYVEFTPSIQTLILNYWRSWAADKSHSHAGRQYYLDLWIHFIFSLIVWQHLYLFVTLKSEHINFHLIPCHRKMTTDPSRSAFTPIFNILEVYEDKCLLISSEEGSNDMHPFLLFILDININTPYGIHSNRMFCKMNISNHWTNLKLSPQNFSSRPSADVEWDTKTLGLRW